MNIGSEEIGVYVDSIWGTVLGLNTRPEGSFNAPQGQSGYLTGCIQITGGWDGAVTLDCPIDLARRAAAIMFGMTAEEATTEQVHDAIGELTNMIGGNLKSLLPGPCYLCLPAVADGSDYALRVLGSRVLSRTAFECEGQRFQITIAESDRSKSRKS